MSIYIMQVKFKSKIIDIGITKDFKEDTSFFFKWLPIKCLKSDKNSEKNLKSENVLIKLFVILEQPFFNNNS